MSINWPLVVYFLAMWSASVLAMTGMLVFQLYSLKSIGNQRSYWIRIGGFSVSKRMPKLDFSDPNLKYRREMLTGLALAAIGFVAAVVATTLAQWCGLF